MANNLGLEPLPDPVGHFGGQWRPFWIFRQYGVAGDEQLSPAALGWFIYRIALYVSFLSRTGFSILLEGSRRF